jgi:hypothetical protein
MGFTLWFYRKFNAIPLNSIQIYKVFPAILFWPHKNCVKKMDIKSVKNGLTF